jgi:hypothetical protein
VVAWGFCVEERNRCFGFCVEEKNRCFGFCGKKKTLIRVSCLLPKIFSTRLLYFFGIGCRDFSGRTAKPKHPTYLIKKPGVPFFQNQKGTFGKTRTPNLLRFWKRRCFNLKQNLFSKSVSLFF